MFGEQGVFLLSRAQKKPPLQAADYVAP